MKISESTQPTMILKLPQHIAIIMDGNGRWAKSKGFPRIEGHRVGIQSVKTIVEQAIRHKIEVLSLFAFSSENWQRPKMEVNALMELFFRAIKKEIKDLHKNQVQFRVIGDLSLFTEKLKKVIHDAEELTRHNTGLKLVIAFNYGGRWDIVQAIQKMIVDVNISAENVSTINSAKISNYLSTADLPEPDLFIRTSGEQRISNFFLWQLAYTELYFTDTLWPDFREESFQKALEAFAQRQRRFGLVQEQVESKTPC